MYTNMSLYHILYHGPEPLYVYIYIRAGQARRPPGPLPTSTSNQSC